MPKDPTIISPEDYEKLLRDYQVRPVALQEFLEDTIKLCPGCQDEIPDSAEFCVNCIEDQADMLNGQVVS